jgi:hypothetical protein
MCLYVASLIAFLYGAYGSRPPPPAATSADLDSDRR